jgi:hypothetical protein
MPKRRYEQREPTQDWQQIRPLLKDSAQITYEVIRPVILKTIPKRGLTAYLVCPRIGMVSSNESVKRARRMTLLLGTCAQTFQRPPTAGVAC